MSATCDKIQTYTLTVRARIFVRRLCSISYLNMLCSSECSLCDLMLHSYANKTTAMIIIMILTPHLRRI